MYLREEAARGMTKAAEELGIHKAQDSQYFVMALGRGEASQAKTKSSQWYQFIGQTQKLLIPQRLLVIPIIGMDVKKINSLKDFPLLELTISNFIS